MENNRQLQEITAKIVSTITFHQGGRHSGGSLERMKEEIQAIAFTIVDLEVTWKRVDQFDVQPLFIELVERHGLKEGSAMLDQFNATLKQARAFRAAKADGEGFGMQRKILH